MPFDFALAEKSAAEFASKIRPDMNVSELAALWRAHYMTAGHKALGRVILELTHVSPASTPVPVPQELA